MSIHHKVEKNSLEWMLVRSGIPTASEFKNILTPKTMRLSASARNYMLGLVGEWWVGHPFTGPETDWMARGIEMEDEAVKAFEFQMDIETEPAGFFTTDDGLIGCTPDRLVGDKGVLELKCPSPAVHMRYLITGEIEDEYRCQLQGELWVPERDIVYLVSYHPEFPAVVIEVTRDERFIAAEREAVRIFVDQMLEMRLEFERRFGPPKPRPVPAEKQPEQPDGLDISDEDVDRIFQQGAE